MNIRNSTLWNRLISMPPFLRLFVCGWWLLAFMMLASTVLPGWRSEDGMPITTKEAWLRGDALVVFLIAAVLYGLATLIYRRSSLARPALLLMFATNGIYAIVSESTPIQFSLVYLLIIAIPLVAVYLYLYRNKSVISYFRQDIPKAQQAAPPAPASRSCAASPGKPAPQPRTPA